MALTHDVDVENKTGTELSVKTESGTTLNISTPSGEPINVVTAIAPIGASTAYEDANVTSGANTQYNGSSNTTDYVMVYCADSDLLKIELLNSGNTNITTWYAFNNSLVKVSGITTARKIRVTRIGGGTANIKAVVLYH